DRVRGPGRSLIRLLGGVAVAAAALAAPAAAQQRVRDLELSGGLSVEAYRGNLTAASASLPDSSESAAAAVGELGARGTFALLQEERRWLFLSFDGGLRQFAA